MESASLETILRAYLDSDDIADTLRLELFFLLGDYLCELGRCRETLDLCADAISKPPIQGDSCMTGLLNAYLGGIYTYMGDYQRAESLYIKTLSHLPECPLSYKCSLFEGLAQVYVSLAKHEKAIDYYKQALRLYAESDGEEFEETIMCLTGLAHAYKRQGKFHESESVYLESIALAEKHYGPYHPQLIPALISIGGLYLLFGEYHQSEEVLQRARLICDSTPALYSGYRAGLYATLGVQYIFLGKYDEGRTHLRLSLDIQDSLPVKDMINIAIDYNWLATAELEMGNYDTAIAVFKKANEIYKTVFSDHHPHQASSLTYLADIYLRRGNYGQAKLSIDSALAIYEKTLGTDHPYYGISLVRKGEILHASGQYEKALQFFDQGAVILDRHYDPLHTYTARALEGLAKTYCSMGNITKGRRYYREFLSRRLKFIEYAFSFSSDEQKLRWVNNHPVIDNSLISLAIITDDPRVVRDACEMVLRGKGIVIDALATQHETAYCSYDSTIMALVNRHRETSETIAALASIGKYHESDIYRKDTIEVLYGIKDSLENDLSRHCSRFSDLLASLRFDLKDITGALSPEETLLEYIRYMPYDFKGTGNSAMRTRPARYAVFIVSDEGNVRVLDLGSADEIDSLIHESLAMIHATGVEAYTPAGVFLEQQLRRITGKLHDIILAPVYGYLSGHETIFVSPDGALNLLPFEILPDSDSTYVIERLHIQYLSSGRDLIRNPLTDNSARPYALIVADPELDMPLTVDGQLTPAIVRRADSKPVGHSSGKFTPLPYTRYEAMEISGYFQASHKLETAELYGSEASERALKDLAEPPRVLHLAAHGLLCGDSLTLYRSGNYNPMLRAGLALAGANSYPTSSNDNGGMVDDGILYALEIATLNLQNTELAVLSACETGTGDILDGEGVFGLRRAFQQAGVQAIVMSLWTVPDRETSRLMSGFYRRWLEGTSKSESLRQSSLEILLEQRLRRGNGHPYYWGGFILVGNSN